MADVNDYVTIETAANEAVADMIRLRLEEGGVPCVLVPGNTVAVAGAGAAFSVTVPSDRADEARQILSG
jgi:hypothetical protein